MHVEQFDARLDDIIDSAAPVETVVEGGELGTVPEGTLDYGASLESPLWWDEGDFLIFSDVARNRVMKWSDADGLSVFVEPSGHANGLWRDRQGRLLLCEHSGRQVTRIEPDGSRTVVMRNYRGRR
jgi:sugar lactone lactonase YvrE